MTMGDDDLYASMALPGVVLPILEKLEKRDPAAIQSLKGAFIKAEAQHPGFTLDLVTGILQKAEVDKRVDMSECMLRLEGSNTCTEFQIFRPEEPLMVLNERSISLKKILSRIPDEIFDRKKFLETIKDTASAIRLLLDSVNNIFVFVNGPYKQNLEARKKEFVRFSRNFSNTLKEFFRDGEKQNVFLSANHLVNQTNLLMKTVKDALN